MSIKATNFVRGLRGLTPTEKVAAMILADHANHTTGEITVGMSTLAEECGFAHRQTASEIVGRLIGWKVFLCPHPSKGRKPNVLFVNYNLASSGSPVKIAPLNRNSLVAVNRNSPVAVEPQPGPSQPQSSGDENGLNRNPRIAGREKKERENHKERENTHTLASLGRACACHPFNGFAAAYPPGRRVGLKRALGVWQKLTCQERETAWRNLDAWKQGRWQFDESRYIPHIENFFRKGYWQQPPPQEEIYAPSRPLAVSQPPGRRLRQGK